MKTKNFPTGTCIRCSKHTGITIMSRFNTDEICLDCKCIEEQHPDYPKAQKAELAAVKAGIKNFAGIGLPKEYIAWRNKLSNFRTINQR